MKHTLKRIVVLMIAILPGISHSVAAGNQEETKHRTFQFSFITPVGSNGLASWNVENSISINLLAGYAGGLDGAEFSGLGSVLKKNMRGAQFSGLGSVVLGDVRGVQFSGLFNLGLKTTTGLQCAGLASLSAGKTRGVQLSGLLNYAPGEKVTQIGGLANVVATDNKGFQLAGLLNVNARRLSGVQLSGLFNYAGHLRGVQLGVFNYADSLEKGVPVGFLSFVRNGYVAVEAGATETLYGVVSFKTGVKQFYNILSVGGGTRDGKSLFAWGYGLGAFFPVSQKTGISLDGICYQVNEGEWFTDRLNLLNKINLNFSWNLAKHFALYGGLSWNVTVCDITDEYGDPVTPHIAPWSVFDETYDDHINVKMYPGISAGIRL